ncbi:MAG: MauE/DoxX family redox-associated membrane protein, partial [Anaerolineales bacterium]
FGFGLAIGLLGLFSLVLWVAIRKGNPISCGCFGPSQRPISRFDIGRNMGLIFVALLGMASFCMTPGAPMPPGIAEQILVAMISITLTVLWINFGALAGFLEWADSAQSSSPT